MKDSRLLGAAISLICLWVAYHALRVWGSLNGYDLITSLWGVFQWVMAAPIYYVLNKRQWEQTARWLLITSIAGMAFNLMELALLSWVMNNLSY